MKPLALLFSIALLLSAGCGNKSNEQPKAENKYPVLTVEILKSIPDKELEGAVVEHIDFKINGNDAETYKIVTGLSKGFQTVYATWWVEAEVNNGGFNQYFWNSWGQFQNDALEGYKTLGAMEHAALMEEAIKIHQGETERLKQFKAKGTLQSFSDSYKDDPLKPCDDKFYKLKSDPSALRIKYIRDHPELFVDK